MALETKEVTCNHCGNLVTISEPKDYCRGCGRKVYYNPRDQRLQIWKVRYYYVVTGIFLAIGIYLVIKFWQVMQ